MSVTVVFVHGAFIRDAQWWWHRVGPLLAEQGVESIAVDLPSCGESGSLGDLHDDAAAVREAVNKVDGPVILIGHSYGGMVITEAGDNNPKVAHLVYMSAVVPDGTSVLDAEFTNPADTPKFDVRDDGTVGEGGTKTNVLGALPDESLVPESLNRLQRQRTDVFYQVADGAAWKDVPSTFIVCTEDADVGVERQREHARRCGAAVEVPTNHFAHLERPDLVAGALLAIAERLPAQPSAV